MHYQWNVTLNSTPEQLWTYVADTDRLNRDIGFSEILLLDQADTTNNRKRARQLIAGWLVQEWTEEPFQWVRPYHYTTLRNYTKGIFHNIRQQMDMKPLPDGGTELIYQLWVKPANPLWRFLIHRSFRSLRFDDLFHYYDDMIQSGHPSFAPPAFVTSSPSEFEDNSKERLSRIKRELVDMTANEEIVALLTEHITQADDLSLIKIRPYILADVWSQPRREVLEACLLGTQVGLLDMSWDLLCPSCRNRKASVSSLSEIGRTVHCDVCQIDYNANFEQSVELSFKPNANIRTVEHTEYCVGGPEITPHIVVQRLLAPGAEYVAQANLQPGRYRVRTMTQRGGQYFRVESDAPDTLSLRASELQTWRQDEPHIGTTAYFELANDSREEQLFVIEHLEWSDKAVTAAEVTTRQVFRDLFSSEALRPNEQISIGSLTVVFTDLLGSTEMFHRVGDAPAFGTVMEHFDVLRESIRRENGAIVKNIGDAIMAVFQQPEEAVRAMLNAQTQLSDEGINGEKLGLRVGIHTGRCIAVTLNGRLDYFGLTVNLAARLEGLSSGRDMVISDEVYADPAVRDFLSSQRGVIHAAGFQSELKGFADTRYKLWRLAKVESSQAEAP